MTTRGCTGGRVGGCSKPLRLIDKTKSRTNSVEHIYLSWIRRWEVDGNLLLFHSLFECQSRESPSSPSPSLSPSLLPSSSSSALNIVCRLTNNNTCKRYLRQITARTCPHFFVMYHVYDYHDVNGIRQCGRLSPIAAPPPHNHHHHHR